MTGQLSFFSSMTLTSSMFFSVLPKEREEKAKTTILITVILFIQLLF